MVLDGGGTAPLKRTKELAMTTTMIQHTPATLTAVSEIGSGEVTLSMREIKTLLAFAQASHSAQPEAQKAVRKVLEAILPTQHHVEV
jgi:hypothetical protein